MSFVAVPELAGSRTNLGSMTSRSRKKSAFSYFENSFNEAATHPNLIVPKRSALTPLSSVSNLSNDLTDRLRVLSDAEFKRRCESVADSKQEDYRKRRTKAIEHLKQLAKATEKAIAALEKLKALERQ